MSNPPFFDHGDSPNNSRKLARDMTALPLDDLVSGASQLLSHDGRLALILPIAQENHLQKILQKFDFTLARMTKVRGHVNSPFKRILVECRKITQKNANSSPQQDELIIEHQRHIYTEQYKALVREFYMKM